MGLVPHLPWTGEETGTPGDEWRGAGLGAYLLSLIAGHQLRLPQIQGQGGWPQIGKSGVAGPGVGGDPAGETAWDQLGSLGRPQAPAPGLVAGLGLRCQVEGPCLQAAPQLSQPLQAHWLLLMPS